MPESMRWLLEIPETGGIITAKETIVLLKGLGEEEKKMGIALVLTAGVKTEVFMGQIRLPFLFGWPPMKWLRKPLGLRIKVLDQLKTETVSRLEKALDLFIGRETQTIIASGGYGTPSAELMKKWLVEHGVPEKAILTDSQSVSTNTNVANSSEELAGSRMVFLVSSWYHTVRARKLLRKRLPPTIPITEIEAFPPLSWECLREEYLYNLLTEPLKRLASLFPALLRFFDRSERKAREENHR